MFILDKTIGVIQHMTLPTKLAAASSAALLLKETKRLPVDLSSSASHDMMSFIRELYDGNNNTDVIL